MKVNFFNLIAFNSVTIFALYIFMFIIYPENSNYFQCNVLTSNISKSLELTYLIPVSCDLEVYMVGVNDFSSIVEFDYNYQTRPLYILSIKFIYIILSKLIGNILILEFMSFLVFHLFITTFSILVVLKCIPSFRDKSASLIYLISGLIILNPIIRYGLFDSAHQTLTLLTFAGSLYFLTQKPFSSSKLYLYALIIGLLSMANVSIVLSTIFLLYNKIKKINQVIQNFSNILITFILVAAPKILWNFYISSKGFIPYNSATQYWHQFVWIKDFILANYENVDYNLSEGGYYCMSVPLFVKCYLLDFFKTIIYLSLPILTIFANFYALHKRKTPLIYGYLKNLLLIQALLFSFWAFIGWYPPLRFNLYSIGYFVTLMLCIQFSYLPRDGKFLMAYISVLIYYLFLPHWNYLEILKLNLGLIVSYILFVIYILKIYKENKKSTSSSL